MIVHCPFCQERYDLGEEYLGISIKCSSCQKVFVFGEATQPQFSESRNRGIKEYKVLVKADDWFEANFDPAILEGELNRYAEEGWRVVSSSVARHSALTGGNSRDEIIIILERDKMQ